LRTQHKLGGALGVHVTGISHAMKRNTANGDAGLPCYKGAKDGWLSIVEK
jgi:hypothetical protein